MLRVFVYGTLKRGERNHERYCRGHLGAVPATVRGWLYDLPNGHPQLGLGYGYPALVVPQGAILAVGTGSYASDAAAGESAVTCVGAAAPPVHGEILLFDDPDRRLPTLDALEGFVPDAQSLYWRVLLAATPDAATDTSIAVWTYVVDDAPGTPLPDGRWSARATGKALQE